MSKSLKPKNANSSLIREDAFKRKHKATFLLNDKENEALEVYCKKYKVQNKSQFMREVVMRTVMEQFMQDYPTLFAKQELDNLVVHQVAEP